MQRGLWSICLVLSPEKECPEWQEENEMDGPLSTFSEVTQTYFRDSGYRSLKYFKLTEGEV